MGARTAKSKFCFSAPITASIWCSKGYGNRVFLGDAKEQFDFYRNKMYKGLDNNQATIDKQHDLSINAIGRLRGGSGLYNSAEEVCAEYHLQNPSFPKKYW